MLSERLTPVNRWRELVISGARQYDKVDPAALLVAAIAVSITTIGEVGPWSPIGTVTDLVIGVIVFCFTWPHAPQEVERPDYWIISAQSLVFGLIASVAFAWPAQSFFVDEGCVWNPGPRKKAILEAGNDVKGTWFGILAGAFVALASWFLLRRASKRLIAKTRQVRQRQDEEILQAGVALREEIARQSPERPHLRITDPHNC